ISLILSLILLCVANRAVYRTASPGETIFLCGLAVFLGPYLLMFFFPLVLVNVLLLLVILWLWRLSRRGPWLFLASSCLATVLTYGVAGWFVWNMGGSSYARLRETYPYESVEERLLLRPHEPDRALPSGEMKRLETLEQAIELETNLPSRFRNDRLAQ